MNSEKSPERMKTMARFNPVQAALANGRSQGRSTHKVVDTRRKGKGRHAARRLLSRPRPSPSILEIESSLDAQVRDPSSRPPDSRHFLRRSHSAVPLSQSLRGKPIRSGSILRLWARVPASVRRAPPLWPFAPLPSGQWRRHRSRDPRVSSRGCCRRRTRQPSASPGGPASSGHHRSSARRLLRSPVPVLRPANWNVPDRNGRANGLHLLSRSRGLHQRGSIEPLFF
jgi:hypothetical protein